MDAFISVQVVYLLVPRFTKFLSFAIALSIFGHVRTAPNSEAQPENSLIGTWVYDKTPLELTKVFIVYNSNGTSRMIAIGQKSGSGARIEYDGEWKVEGRMLLEKIIKAPYSSVVGRKSKSEIVSADSRELVLRDSKDGMLRLHSSNLPRPLPPLAKVPGAFVFEQAKKLAVYTPQPEYPFEARAHHVTGSGAFVLHIKVGTGIVRSVEVRRSTGSAMLDSSTIAALKQWRFKPGTLRTIDEISPFDTKYAFASQDAVIHVPVNFVMHGSTGTHIPPPPLDR